MQKYAKEHGFSNTRSYVDDGYTGTNFNRPGFQKLLEDIEMGYVSVIIVKDMSRLGRDYLQVGYYIRADAIEQVVMLELKRMAMFLQSDEEAFADLLAQKTQKDIINEQKALQGELQRCTARNQKIAELYEKLYEDNISCKVTDEWFMQLAHKYEAERMAIKTKIASLNERISNLGTMQQNKDRFIGAIRKFMEMQNLTAPLLREPIDEIMVYETEGVGKNRSQRIMVHYKFIGHIEISECGSNYKTDTRKGVAVEYITKSA